MSFLEDFDWARPAGMLLLLWIVAILWRLRRKAAPLVLATGTLELWRAVQSEDAPIAAESRRHVPPRAWLWFLGLIAASLAVVDLQKTREPLAPLHVFHVDRTPSMYLPLNSSGETTRLEHAVSMVLEWLEEEDIPAEAREWRSSGAVPVRGARPPAAWMQAPKRPHDELPIELYDDPALTVVTDRGRDSTSGLIASGGDRVFGWVAESDGRALLWDGRLVRQDGKLSPRGLATGSSLSPELRELILIWASERGHEVRGEAAAEFVFELGPRTANATDPRTLWLEPLTPDDRPSDPAYWAVLRAEELDRILPARAGIVALEERRAVGDSELRPGTSVGAEPTHPGVPFSAWLAILSLVCALGAFWPGAAPATGARASNARKKLGRAPQ